MGSLVLQRYERPVTSYALFFGLLTCALTVSPVSPYDRHKMLEYNNDSLDNIARRLVVSLTQHYPHQSSVSASTHSSSLPATSHTFHTHYSPLNYFISKHLSLPLIEANAETSQRLIYEAETHQAQPTMSHLLQRSTRSSSDHTLLKFGPHRFRRTSGSIKLLGLDNLDFTSSTLDRALESDDASNGSWQVDYGARVRDQAPPARISYPSDQRRPNNVKFKDIRKMLQNLENAGR